MNTNVFATESGVNLAPPARPWNLLRRSPRGMLAGLAVSLLLHAWLLYSYRTDRTPEPPPPGKQLESMMVWVRPAPLPVPLTPKPPPAITAEQPAKPPPKKIRRERQADEAPRNTAAPASAAPSTSITLPPSNAPDPSFSTAPEAPATPRFDPEAARRTARSMASERDPAKAGTALGQIPEKPLRTESRLARGIAEAKRPDCKDGIPGGLLAPLLLLADKKDSGCKW